MHVCVCVCAVYIDKCSIDVAIYSCQSECVCVVFDLLPVKQTFVASTSKTHVGEKAYIYIYLCVCVGVCVCV